TFALSHVSTRPRQGRPKKQVHCTPDGQENKRSISESVNLWYNLLQLEDKYLTHCCARQGCRTGLNKGFE
ncbi:MAG TPA: hypothetical protein PKV82_15300, partial [Anaerolineae bacterium]|nr:hypothetical protein [Anaerolineae bacterium]